MVLAIFSLFAIINNRVYGNQLYPKTPPDQEGPFYPVEQQSDEDNDLTYVKGREKRAQGETLYLSGIVVSSEGKPQKESTVKIWQTDTNGKYKHPEDTVQSERDANFQYWGSAETDRKGEFTFKTIIPGKYFPRPAHIHFKVWSKGELVLTSQIYLIKSKNKSFHLINEHLKLKLILKGAGEYTGFFRIII